MIKNGAWETWFCVYPMIMDPKLLEKFIYDLYQFFFANVVMPYSPYFTKAPQHVETITNQNVTQVIEPVFIKKEDLLAMKGMVNEADTYLTYDSVSFFTQWYVFYFIIYHCLYRLV